MRKLFGCPSIVDLIKPQNRMRRGGDISIARPSRKPVVIKVVTRAGVKFKSRVAALVRLYGWIDKKRQCDNFTVGYY